MAIRTLFVDPSRCIGCRSCEAACRECDSHKGESMVMVDFLDRRLGVATQPTVCMHCEEPLAPCAQVCPVMAILVSADGVVHQADASRCIACQNCVYACPFGVPKIDVAAKLMKKCNLCYDRTSRGLKPWCAQVCPTSALWYGDFEEFSLQRRGQAVRRTAFGTQEVRTRVFHVLPSGEVRLEIPAEERQVRAREEAWVL
jgi:Fe-S-cluster-containing dehydrogenase component